MLLAFLDIHEWRSRSALVLDQSEMSEEFPFAPSKMPPSAEDMGSEERRRREKENSL